MIKIAKRLESVSSSQTLEITSIAKALKKQGKDVIDFSAGEPDFDTPEPIKKAAIYAIESGFTKYTPASGMEELKLAIQNKFLKDNNIRYSPNQIIVSCGAKHSLYNIIQTICDPKDEMLIIAPFWLSYPEMVKMADGTPVIIDTDEEKGFKLKISSLKEKITKKTKAVIVNSPSNPAGIVYDKKFLQEIADIVVSKKIICISDEIYEKLIYDGEKHVSIASLGDDIYRYTVTVNGMSKTYAMTGWRIGYLGAEPTIAKYISILQSHSTSNPASISQKAALRALNVNESIVEKMRAEFEKRRDYMMTRLDEIKSIHYTRPTGAFYIYCNIYKTKLKSQEFATKFLEEKLVAVIPGESFGSDKHIRLSFATDIEKIKEGMDRLEQWVKQ